MKLLTLLSILSLSMLLQAGSSFASSSTKEAVKVGPKPTHFSQIKKGDFAPITANNICMDRTEHLFLPAQGQIEWRVSESIDPSPIQPILLATAFRRHDGFDVAVHIPQGLAPIRNENDFKQAMNAAIVFSIGSKSECSENENLIPINGIGLEGHGFLSNTSTETVILPFVTRKTK